MRTNMFDKRNELAKSFDRIRAGFLRHKKWDSTVNAFLGRFEEEDPTPLMLFPDSGKCTNAGISFSRSLCHEAPEDRRMMVGCLIQAIGKLKLKRRLTDDREVKLIQDIIVVLQKSANVTDAVSIDEAVIRLRQMTPQAKESEGKKKQRSLASAA